MRVRAAVVVLLWVWPAFGQEYRFASVSGEVDDVLAAYAFLQREAELEQLHAAAVARHDARSVQVWSGLEDFVRELGVGIADRASEPHCLFVPVGCTPDWSKFDGLSRTKPGGIRLRQVLAEAFKREARQRGLENRLAMSLVNSILAGVLVASAVKPPLPPEVRAGAAPGRLLGVEQDSIASQRLASLRQGRVEALARDPAQGGKITPKTIREAKAALGLEEAGELRGPVVRDPSGGADFTDGVGQSWDVKAFTSRFAPQKGGFELNDALGKLKKAFDTGEQVILDTADLAPQHLAALKAEIRARGWDGRVRYWPR